MDEELVFDDFFVSSLDIPGAGVNFDELEGVGFGTSGAPPSIFKMRGRDDGRPAGSDYIVWVHQGDEADWAGSGFSGGTPTPIGNLVAGSVVVVG